MPTGPNHSDFSFDHLDDLGRENGKFKIPFAAKARELVLSESIRAIGHRPIDYAQRDLLIGGWLLDPRGFRFRALQKDPRLFANTFGRPESDRKEIARFRAFQYLHLAKLLSVADGSKLDEKMQRVVQSLICCPPTLVLLDDEALRRSNRKTCKRPRFCPYCTSRSARDLYERLSGEYRQGSAKALGLLSITMTDDHLMARTERGETSRVQKIAQTLRTQLRRDAQEQFGMKGGITTFCVGPNLRDDVVWNDGELHRTDQYGLEYYNSFLGEIPLARLAQLGRSESLEGIEREVSRIPSALGEVRTHLTIRLCWTSDALRSLLFGQWPQTDRQGVGHGAYRFAPWYLAPSEQWHEHLNSTRNLPLFRFWGDWKGKFKVQKPQRNRFQNADRRRGRYRSRQNLRSGNDRRQVEKAQAIGGVEAEVRPLWDRLCEEIGRPPGRTLLMRESQSAGIELSERHARNLVKRFKIDSEKQPFLTETNL